MSLCLVRLHRLYSVHNAAYCDRWTRSVVCQSVSLNVGLSRGCAEQKRLNESRCCREWRLLVTQGALYLAEGQWGNCTDCKVWQHCSHSMRPSPSCSNRFILIKGKAKLHTRDIAPLSEGISPQKRSGMARIVEGFHSFTCTPMRLSTNWVNHTCFCLPNWSWSSFTDPG